DRLLVVGDGPATAAPYHLVSRYRTVFLVRPLERCVLDLGSPFLQARHSGVGLSHLLCVEQVGVTVVLVQHPSGLWSAVAGDGAEPAGGLTRPERGILTQREQGDRLDLVLPLDQLTTGERLRGDVPHPRLPDGG